MTVEFISVALLIVMSIATFCIIKIYLVVLSMQSRLAQPAFSCLYSRVKIFVFAVNSILFLCDLLMSLPVLLNV